MNNVNCIMYNEDSPSARLFYFKNMIVFCMVGLQLLFDWLVLFVNIQYRTRNIEYRSLETFANQL